LWPKWPIELISPFLLLAEVIHKVLRQQIKRRQYGMSMETTDTGNSSKTPEACRRETEEHKLKTAV
jgi:hypothetical protein